MNLTGSLKANKKVNKRFSLLVQKFQGWEFLNAEVTGNSTIHFIQ
jgi:hypothetical protein